ncbi:ATP-binding cassette subfamily C protein [Hasllibacter halocynthiae]|uniref:ATP-binding cassette subfamily C protein n=2 Tax=Hasllibacter halocynthiae TaxID=595589 RepID=A0A2T0X1X1_9RHOB|nr:ATP-binding cassette subfamily C protein [Hasllibacter halocynthiae]
MTEGGRQGRIRQGRLRAGRGELAAVRAEGRGLLWAIGLFSVFVNLLMLTGPIFMLQVYDRVLSSRSEETLLALTGLVAFLYGMMALLDHARQRVAARLGARFRERLEERVLGAVLTLSARSREGGDGARAVALRDLDQVRGFLGMPVFTALFDLPFVPLFLAGIFIFHPLMGWVAVAGGTVLVVVTVLNGLLTSGLREEARRADARAEGWSDALRRDAETVESLGMRAPAAARWKRSRDEAARAGLAAADRTGGFTVATRTWRLLLQSLMLATGAWLVLQGELRAGAMIAGSILLGRALAPVEQIVGGWPAIQAVQAGWGRLADLLGAAPQEAPRTKLPRPEARVEARALTVLPPGSRHATLRGIAFDLPPGQAMGVIGGSGAGKTTLARALIGLWPAAGGSVRLGGAALDRYDPDALGRLIGYLPQQVRLFDGTVKENIARLDLDPDDAAVVDAAKRAAAHEMILELPEGYDTPIDALGGRLSGGQVQRIGLARALYGDPALLVLDEPNANLDHVGTVALNEAIDRAKADGRSAIVMAHRPSAIERCELLLMLEGGQARAFGPTAEVLPKITRNHAQIATLPKPAAAAAAAAAAAREGKG